MGVVSHEEGERESDSSKMDGVKQKREILKKTLNNPFSFMEDHILASDVGPRFVNPIFYSFHNYFLLASMKKKFQVFSLRTGFVLRTSFHTNTIIKRDQDLYFAKDC